MSRLDRLIDDLNGRRLAFAVHVGDIGTTRQACSDAWLDARKAQFGRIRAPFILLPGDNEWSDCHTVGADPAARLRKWRAAFCFGERMQVERQAGEYCEHVRWRLGDTLFVAVNVPGHDNNGRAPEEVAARMKAVMAWLDAAEKLAPRRLVILMQANPFLPFPALSTLRDRLERFAERMPGRVVLVHGDTHLYQDDEPLRGLRRIEVWGAPRVNWLRGALVQDRLVVEPAAQF